MTASKRTPPDSPPLVVYGREDCHLCLDMIAALGEWQKRLGFRLEIVDVDSDEDLKLRYGERVPVLMTEGEEICHYYLNLPALDAYFTKIR